jgi:hypothetical protein
MPITAPIQFTGDFEKVISEFTSSTKKMAKSAESSASSFGFLETAIKGAIAAFTVDKIISGLKTVTDRASEAEEASLRLSNALIGTGDNTDKNIRLFKEMGKQLEATSKYDDDFIISQVALAKQFGVTNKEAEKMIRAAVDLSAVTGDDLTTTIRQLGMTLDGTAGRMAQQFPVLQRLTAEQLRNGAAIDILGKQYLGASERGMETFKGQTTQLSKSFGNLEESIGMVIIKNPTVIADIKELSASFVKLTEYVDKNSDTLSRWITNLVAGTKLLAKGSLAIFGKDFEGLTNAFADFEKATGRAVVNVDLFGGKLDGLVQRFNPITGKMESFNGSLASTKDKLNAVGGSFNYLTGKLDTAFDASATKFDRFANETLKNFEELKKKLQDVGATPLETLQKEYERNVKTLDKARTLGASSQKTNIELLGKLELKYAREAGEERKRQFAELVGKIQAAYASPVSALFKEKELQNPNGSLGLSEGTQRGAAAGLGVLNNMFQGAEGARNLLGSAASAVGVALLGPLGAVVGDLVKALSQGPGFVKDMVSNFMDALPELVANIAEAIPVVLETLVEKLPDVIQKLVEKSPLIIERLVQESPRIIWALITLMPKVVGALVAGAYQVVARWLAGAGGFVAQILKGAYEFVAKLIDGAGKFLESATGTGKGGVVHDIWTGITGNSDGGNNGIINDSVPLVGWLKGGAGSGPQTQAVRPMVVSVQISNKQLAQALVDLNKLGYSV